ncbi:MAG: hypothetical protein JW893_08010 [Candidatus Omnitrophica bacterium]|nr:hypothetical protein [Candidatus Omnitrophota bacterium]
MFAGIHEGYWMIYGGIALAVLTSIVAITIPIMVIRRTNKRISEKYSRALGVKDFKAGVQYRAESNGGPYFYYYHPGGRNSSPSLKVWIDCQTKGEFSVGKETGFEKFFKVIGISSEIQTGDVEFDENFYIRTNAISFATAYFSEAQKRSAARRIFSLGFNSLSLKPRRLTVELTPFTPDKFDPAAIEDAVRELQILSRDIPTDYPETSFLGAPAWKTKRILAFGLAGVALVAGILTLILGNNFFKPFASGKVFLFGLKFSIPAFFIFLFLVVQWLKGRANSHVELLVILGMSLVGFPMLSYGTVTIMNGYHDEGPVARYHQPVIGKRISHSKDSTYYYLVVPSWREGYVQEEFSVGRSLYQRAVPQKSYLHINTKPGKLKFEWLDGYRLEE